MSTEVYEGLKRKIRSFVRVEDKELEEIVNRFDIRTIARNDLLLKEGGRCNYWGFIHSGLLRSYSFTSNGEEYTNWLIREGAFICHYNSFYSGEPARVNVIALEETTIICVNAETLTGLFDEYPIFEKFGRRLLEQLLIGIKERNLYRAQLDATQRYWHFVQTQPELIKRVPLKYIASFLGMTESSLSRIRRGAAQQNQAQ